MSQVKSCSDGNFSIGFSVLFHSPSILLINVANDIQTFCLRVNEEMEMVRNTSTTSVFTFSETFRYNRIPEELLGGSNVRMHTGKCEFGTKISSNVALLKYSNQNQVRSSNRFKTEVRLKLCQFGVPIYATQKSL